MWCGIWCFFGIAPAVFLSEGTRLASWKQLWEYIPWLLLSIGVGSFCIPAWCVEKNRHNEHVTWCEKIRWEVKYPLCIAVYHKGRRWRNGRSLSLLFAYFTVFTEMKLVVTLVKARGVFWAQEQMACLNWLCCIISKSAQASNLETLAAEVFPSFCC